MYFRNLTQPNGALHWTVEAKCL